MKYAMVFDFEVEDAAHDEFNSRHALDWLPLVTDWTIEDFQRAEREGIATVGETHDVGPGAPRLMARNLWELHN